MTSTRMPDPASGRVEAFQVLLGPVNILGIVIDGVCCYTGRVITLHAGPWID